MSLSLVSWPNTTHRVEFFANTVPDSTGYGEGETFLGFKMVTTDALGNATFSFTPSVPLAYGQFITATATDTLHNNTSEFSPLLVAGTKTKVYGDHYVVNTALSGIPLHWADGTAKNPGLRKPSSFFHMRLPSML